MFPRGSAFISRHVVNFQAARRANSSIRGGGTGVQSPNVGPSAGGDGRTMIAGISAVVAGIGIFWYIQRWTQGRNALMDPHAKVPTWHYRLAQQEPKAFPHVPGTTLVQTPIANTQPGSLPLPNDGRNPSDDLTATVLNYVKGKHDPAVARIEQPAPPRRFHETGRVYTKKFDDIAGYKRE